MLVIDPNEEYKHCIIGTDYFGQKAIYDSEEVIKVLMINDKMSYDEAYEYFEFNIVGSYVGDGTPIFIWRKDDSEE